MYIFGSAACNMTHILSCSQVKWLECDSFENQHYLIIKYSIRKTVCEEWMVWSRSSWRVRVQHSIQAVEFRGTILIFVSIFSSVWEPFYLLVILLFSFYFIFVAIIFWKYFLLILWLNCFSLLRSYANLYVAMCCMYVVQHVERYV